MMKFERKLNRILEIFLVILMSVLVIDVLWQVFSRYLLASPSSFTDELAGYLLIWVGMLGAAYVAGRQEHLAIDIVLQRSRPSVKKRLSLIIHLMILLFAVAVMVVGGIILMYTRFVLEVKSAALQLPLGYVYIVMPISGLIIVYYKILHIQELRITD
jgi:TRAP-type C4-dicarboxylate transport system permease small subunit